MRRPSALATLLCAWLVVSHGWYVPAVRAADEAPPGDHEAAGIREMLEGASGTRETWASAPTLVVLGAVMEYRLANATARYRATEQVLTAHEQQKLIADLTEALAMLTGGALTRFAGVEVEPLVAGDTATLFRPDTIVVGQFRGVRTLTGTLGYGGRATRDGTITAGAVILDSESDRDARWQRALRMHELGHALGYNHVVSRQSVMNPHVGSTLTDFDRQAIRIAFASPAR